MSTDLELNQDVPIMSVRADFQEHNWIQRGNELECGGGCGLVSNTNASGHGVRIKSGLLLTGSRGSWKLEEEKGIIRDHLLHVKAQRLAEELRT